MFEIHCELKFPLFSKNLGRSRPESKKSGPFASTKELKISDTVSKYAISISFVSDLILLMLIVLMCSQISKSKISKRCPLDSFLLSATVSLSSLKSKSCCSNTIESICCWASFSNPLTGKKDSLICSDSDFAILTNCSMLSSLSSPSKRGLFHSHPKILDHLSKTFASLMSLEMSESGFLIVISVKTNPFLGRLS